MKSSYVQSKYSNIFKSLCFSLEPKKVVEFGILEGYSLQSLIDSCSSETQISAYDIFDEFPFNAANLADVKNKFSKFPNVNIEKKDFYGAQDTFLDGSIDILHVDIANNGSVFEYVFENYMCKISKGGVCILEGGSEERDGVHWMKKYNKPKIGPVLKKYKNKFKIIVLKDFPSITIIKSRSSIEKA